MIIQYFKTFETDHYTIKAMKISLDPILPEEFSFEERKPSVSKIWKKTLAFGILILLFLIPTIVFSIMLKNLNSKLDADRWSLKNDLEALQEETKTLSKQIKTHEHPFMSNTTGKYIELIMMINSILIKLSANLLFLMSVFLKLKLFRFCMLQTLNDK